MAAEMASAAQSHFINICAFAQHHIEKHLRSRRGRTALVITAIATCLLIFVPLSSQTLNETTTNSIIANELAEIAKPPLPSPHLVEVKENRSYSSARLPTNHTEVARLHNDTTSRPPMGATKGLSRRKGRPWLRTGGEVQDMPATDRDSGSREPLVLQPLEYEPSSMPEAAQPELTEHQTQAPAAVEKKRRNGKLLFRFKAESPATVEPTRPNAQTKEIEKPDSLSGVLGSKPLLRRRGQSRLGVAIQQRLTPLIAEVGASSAETKEEAHTSSSPAPSAVASPILEQPGLPDSPPGSKTLLRRRGQSRLGVAIQGRVTPLLAEVGASSADTKQEVHAPSSPVPSAVAAPTPREDNPLSLPGLVDERVNVCTIMEPNVSRLPQFRAMDQVRVTNTFTFTDGEMLSSADPFYPETSLPHRNHRPDVVQHFTKLRCRSRQACGGSRPLFVLSSVRNRPKRALEFAVHHLTLGAAKVIMLDLSTHRYRAGFRLTSIGSAAEHLEALSAAGLVELVFPWNLSSALIGSEERRINATIDLNRSVELREIFFEEMSLQLLSTQPESEVLVLNDVRELVVITGNAELLYSAQVAKHMSIPGWYPCLHDLIRFKEYRGVLLLPVAEVADPKTAFEGPTVSGLELVSFATGDSELMMHRLRGILNRANNISIAERVLLLRQTSRFLGRSGAVSGLLRDEHASSNSGNLFCGGMLASASGCRRDLTFRDGTHLALDFVVKPDVLKNTARVVVVGDSLQRHIADAVDGCFRNPSSRDANSDDMPTFSSASILRQRVEAAEASVIDDIPQQYSIRNENSTFLLFFRDFLQFWGSSHEFNISAITSSARHTSPKRELQLQQRPRFASIQHRRAFVPFGYKINPLVRQIILRLIKSTDISSQPRLQDITVRNLLSKRVVLASEESSCSLDADHVRKLIGTDNLRRSVCPLVVHLDHNFYSKRRALSFVPELLPPASDDVNITLCLRVGETSAHATSEKIVLENILYHKLLGIGRTVVMVTERQPMSASLRKALQPLIKLGMVEVMKEDPDDARLAAWHLNPRGGRVDKLPLMRRCAVSETRRAIRERHSSFPWVAFLDPEDFLVTKQGSGCLAAALQTAAAQLQTSSDNILAGIFFPLRSVKPLVSNLQDNFTTQFERIERRMSHLSDADVMYYPEGQRLMVRSDLLTNGGARLIGTNDVSFEPFVNDNKGAVCTIIDSTAAPCNIVQKELSRGGYAANFAYRSFLSMLQEEIIHNNGPYHFNVDGLYRQFVRLASPVNVSDDDKRYVAARREYDSIPMIDERVELLRKLLRDGRSDEEQSQDAEEIRERSRVGLSLRRYVPQQ